MKPAKQQGEGGGMSKLAWWLGSPVRALSRACDSYVRKMTACAGAMPSQYAGAGGRAGYGGARMQQAATFSSRSTRRGPDGGTDDDVSELVRAMSQRQQQQGQRDVPVPAVQARSRSVAVGRIDEDAPYEFGTDAGSVGLPPLAVRRSRSAAVVGSGLPPRVGGGGGFGASAVTRKPPIGGGGGFGASAVARKPAVGVVHSG